MTGPEGDKSMGWWRVRAAEVVRIVTEVEARLVDFFDDDDLAQAATDAVLAGGALERNVAGLDAAKEQVRRLLE